MRFAKKIGFTDWESRQLCDGAFVVVDQSAESLPALDRQAVTGGEISLGVYVFSAWRWRGRWPPAQAPGTGS